MRTQGPGGAPPGGGGTWWFDEPCARALCGATASDAEWATTANAQRPEVVQGKPGPGADVAGVGPVPAQMWQGWAKSRCRCGSRGGQLLCGSWEAGAEPSGAEPSGAEPSGAYVHMCRESNEELP